MNKLETRTINGIQITPVYYRIWHGEYSTGEWSEVVFRHFTDAKVRGVETNRDKINTLAPIPWEATEEDLAEFEARKELSSSYDRAIDNRRSQLAEMYYNG